MTGSQPNFQAFNNFDMKDLDPQAYISQRMLRRLEDIENDETSGPETKEARAALASSVVAHAVVELEGQLIVLKRQLASRD